MTSAAVMIIKCCIIGINMWHHALNLNVYYKLSCLNTCKHISMKCILWMRHSSRWVCGRCICGSYAPSHDVKVERNGAAWNTTA